MVLSERQREYLRERSLIYNASAIPELKLEASGQVGVALGYGF